MSLTEDVHVEVVVPHPEHVLDHATTSNPRTTAPANAGTSTNNNNNSNTNTNSNNVRRRWQWPSSFGGSRCDDDSNPNDRSDLPASPVHARGTSGALADGATTPNEPAMASPAQQGRRQWRPSFLPSLARQADISDPTARGGAEVPTGKEGGDGDDGDDDARPAGAAAPNPTEMEAPLRYEEMIPLPPRRISFIFFLPSPLTNDENNGTGNDRNALPGKTATESKDDERETPSGEAIEEANVDALGPAKISDVDDDDDEFKGGLEKTTTSPPEGDIHDESEPSAALSLASQSSQVIVGAIDASIATWSTTELLLGLELAKNPKSGQFEVTESNAPTHGDETTTASSAPPTNCTAEETAVAGDTGIQMRTNPILPPDLVALLRPGDILESINGRPCRRAKNLDDLTSRIRQRGTNRGLTTLTFARGEGRATATHHTRQSEPPPPTCSERINQAIFVQSSGGWNGAGDAPKASERRDESASSLATADSPQESDTQCADGSTSVMEQVRPADDVIVLRTVQKGSNGSTVTNRDNSNSSSTPTASIPTMNTLHLDSIPFDSWLEHGCLQAGDVVLSINSVPAYELRPDDASLVISTMAQTRPHVSVKTHTPPLTRMQSIRRAAVAVGGGTMVGVGAVIMATPLHPFGHAMAIGGLGVLGTEFEAPRKAIKSMTRSMGNVATSLHKHSRHRRTPPENGDRDKTDGAEEGNSDANQETKDEDASASEIDGLGECSDFA